MSTKNSTGKGRTRNFVTVVYPESAPVDWKDILVQQCIPAFISPLHDKDVNPTGEVKKAHYHVMIMFDSVKTDEQAIAVFDTIGGVGYERVNSIRSHARYLCHLDNPDKAQYSKNDVIALGGADYFEVIGLASDKHVAIREMIEYCDEHLIYSYADLLRYSMNERADWFRVLCDNGTYVMKEYLKSKSWGENKNSCIFIDKETGEVIHD